MKRRSFIGMLGAAITAPALPMAAPSLSPQLRALAATHARRYPVVTVLGISKRIGVPIEQAETLLADLSRDGLVGPIHPGPAGPYRASSKIFRPSTAANHASEFKQRMDARKQRELKQKVEKARSAEPSKPTDWVTHLHQLCQKNDLTLQPRALELAVA